jgi:hypothetical protein
MMMGSKIARQGGLSSTWRIMTHAYIGVNQNFVTGEKDQDLVLGDGSMQHIFKPHALIQSRSGKIKEMDKARRRISPGWSYSPFSS